MTWMACRSLILPILLLVAGPLMAQDLILKGPSPAQGSLGGQSRIVLEWRVQRGQQDVRMLAPPKVRGLAMQVRGPSRNEMTSVINGRVSKRTTLSWEVILSPQGKGLYEIPPFKVRFGNQIKRSKPSQLRVVENLAAKDACFLEAKVGSTRLYKGQSLEILLSIWIDESIMNKLTVGRLDQHQVGAILQAPWLEDFPAGVVIKPPERSDDFLVGLVDHWIRARFVGSKEKGERSYRVFEVRRRFLLNREGTFTLEPATVQVRFATRYRRNLFGEVEPSSTADGFSKTMVQPFEVLPLPTKGRPTDFSGAVGQYRLSGFLSKTSLAVGESTQLTLKLEGEGDFEFVELPELDDLPGFHRYSRKMERFPDHVLARYEISPVDPGLDSLPAVEFPYFDPVEGSYKRSRLEKIPIHVRKPDNAVELERLPEEGGKLVEGVDDIFDRMPLDQAPPKGWQPSAMLVLASLAAPFLYLLFWFLLWLPWQRSRRDTLGQRKRAAHAHFLQNLDSEGALPAFSLYLAERMGWQPGEAASADLSDRLNLSGVPADLAARTVALMTNLEALRYGSGGQDATLAAQARALVEELERGTKA